jgi:signal transduction histidine kinase
MNRFLSEALEDYTVVREQLLLVGYESTEALNALAAQLLVAARLDQVRDQLNHGVTTFRPDV